MNDTGFFAVYAALGVVFIVVFAMLGVILYVGYRQERARADRMREYAARSSEPRP